LLVTELTVEITDNGGQSVLALSGELDIDSVGKVRDKVQERLADDPPQSLSVDLADLTFIDSSGLGLLIEIRRLALASNVTFGMTNVPSGPARVIAIAGLTETFGLPAPEGPAAGS
jgi:anti-sigma B factor antagonist